MSYLLRNNSKHNKSKLGGAAKAPTVSRLLHRNASTGLPATSRTGGGQLQVQRPAVAQQQQHIQQTVQQQQRVQGVISMEEVIADLRILEEQQVDSQRKLQYARATKQRRLEQQAALEAKLDRLKYQNGQQRAELQRAHELLSEGQRQLNSARSAAAKAGDDLREFDRKLKFALEIKSSLLAHQRTQDRLLGELRNKTAILDRLVKEAAQQCEEAEKDFDKAKHYEMSLRQGIRNEAANQQRIADKAAEIRAESAAQEQHLDLAFKLEKSLRLRLENVHKEVAKEQARHADAEADFEAQQEKKKLYLQQNADKKVRLKEAVAKKKANLHQIWHATIGIQKAEGHTPSPLPSESNIPPVIDLDRIRASVQSEADAATEEAKAKDQLRASVETLQQQLADLQDERSKAHGKLQRLQADNEKNSKIEAERKFSSDQLHAELEQVTKSVDEKSLTAQEFRLALDSEHAELHKEIEAVVHEIRAVHETLQKRRQENANLDAEIIEVRENYNALKEGDQKKLEAMGFQLKEARQRNTELQEEANRMAQKRLQSNETQEQRERRREIDETHQKIAEMLQQYPEVADFTFNYREDLSDRDQAKIDLKYLAQQCIKRGREADEQYAALKEAAKQERKKVEKEAAIGAKKERETCTHMEKQHKLEAHTDQPSAGENSAEEQNNGRTHKDLAAEVSAAKPRSLLGSFLSVSQQPLDDDDDDTDKNMMEPVGGDGAGNVMAVTQPPESEPIFFAGCPSLTQAPQSEPGYLTDADMEQSGLTQEKKVRWQDDGEAYDQSETMTIQVAIPVPQAEKMRRKTFGTSSSVYTSVKTTDSRIARSFGDDLNQKVSKRSSSEADFKSNEGGNKVAKSGRSKGTHSNRTSQDQTTSDKSLSSSCEKVEPEHKSSSNAQRDKAKQTSHMDILGCDLTRPSKPDLKNDKERGRSKTRDDGEKSRRTGSTNPSKSSSHESRSRPSIQHPAHKAHGNSSSKDPNPKKPSKSSSHESRSRPSIQDPNHKAHGNSSSKDPNPKKPSKSSSHGQDPRKESDHFPTKDPSKAIRSSGHDFRGRSSSEAANKTSRQHSTNPGKGSSRLIDAKTKSHSSCALPTKKLSRSSSSDPDTMKSSSRSSDTGMTKSYSSSSNTDKTKSHSSSSKVEKSKIHSKSSDAEKTKIQSGSLGKHQSLERSSSSDPAKKKSRSLVDGKDIKQRSSVPIQKTSGATLKPALKTSSFPAPSQKRSSGQTSGISSQERAPKVRRRKPSQQTSATSKPGLDGFAEDYTFNFNN